MTGLALENPPVVETSLGIQFSDLSGWSLLHHGLFYSAISERFPIYKAREPFPVLIETFPISQKVGVIKFSSGVADCRAEYASEDESMLVSIQKNRFSFHWNRSPDGGYPRYETNSEVCKSEYNAFVEFCQRENLGAVKPVLCEAMYLNRISPRPNETLSEMCERIFTLSLGEFEATTVNRTYILDENRGRLYAEINTSVVDQGDVTFKITSRVRHLSGEVMDTMDIAHNWLIEKFCELTTETARKERWLQK